MDRIRLELVEPRAASWAKQPYHAAEDLSARDARDLVNRGIKSASRMAVREMRTTLKRMEEAGYEVSTCVLLVGEPMPDWTVAQILAVHFRMRPKEFYSAKLSLAPLPTVESRPWKYARNNSRMRPGALSEHD